MKTRFSQVSPTTFQVYLEKCYAHACFFDPLLIRHLLEPKVTSVFVYLIA